MKTKKLSLPRRKISNMLFYQKMDFAKKQTKNEKKWGVAKGKFYSSELGRSIPMIRILKTFSNKWIENFPITQEVGKLQETRSEDRLQKVANLRRKRWWFLGTAAPIPGVSFLKKQKQCFLKNLRAFQTLKRWAKTLSRKQLIFLTNHPEEKGWMTFLLMESLYPQSFEKTGKRINSQQRTHFFQKKLYSVNGKKNIHVRAVMKHGDIIGTKLFQLQVPTLMKTISENSPYFRKFFFWGVAKW